MGANSAEGPAGVARHASIVTLTIGAVNSVSGPMLTRGVCSAPRWRIAGASLV